MPCFPKRDYNNIILLIVVLNTLKNYRLQLMPPLQFHNSQTPSQGTAGISLCGRTGICIFYGVMEATVYTKILDKTLIYPTSHNSTHINSRVDSMWQESKEYITREMTE